MGRIRTIKPSFWKNEDLAELSPWHRLCFIGLWNQADREGRMEDRPRRLKAEIFPFDDIDMDQLLAGLAEKNFITRYVADGAAYLEIPKFGKHQRPKSDEYPSSIPPPLLSDPPRKSAVPRIGDRERTLGEWEIGKGDSADGAALPAQASPDDLMALWNEVTHPPIPHCRDLTSKRKRHGRMRLTERNLDGWREVFERIQASDFCRGINDRGWAASFDWAIGSPDVAVKVLEGKYDNRIGKPREERPFTAKEVEAYESWRRAMNGCGHTPRCETRTECMALFINRRLRGAA